MYSVSWKDTEDIRLQCYQCYTYAKRAYMVICTPNLCTPVNLLQLACFVLELDVRRIVRADVCPFA